MMKEEFISWTKRKLLIHDERIFCYKVLVHNEKKFPDQGVDEKISCCS